MPSANKLLIIGAGPIAGEYARIAKSLGFATTVIGRGEKSAQNFEAHFSIPVLRGGIESNLDMAKTFEKAIIASSEESLDEVAHVLISTGVRKILIEKPGAKSISSLMKLQEHSEKSQTTIHIGYNRRFYQSVIELQKRLIVDGGLESMTFEFTEWGHVIEKLQKYPGIKENWLWHNSSHVIDLAFYIAGEPESITSYKAGSLSWHPSGSKFVGSGITNKNVLFSYHANWDGPGRWGLEFITKKNRYFLRPLEELHIQEKGTVKIEKVILNDDHDKQWKPGFYIQTSRFLNDEGHGLLSLQDQLLKIKTYKKICDEE